MIGALVLGDDLRGLGIARSLGRRGIPVWVMRDPGDRLASASRYVQRALPWPDDDDPAAALLELAGRHGLDGWLLVPTADETAAFLARERERLAERFLVASPPWEMLRVAYDKRLTHRLADAAGVPHPRTAYPRDADEVAALEWEFPAVLKPAVKAVENRFTHDKAWLVNDRAELLQRYAEACELIDPQLIMLQELVPGGGESQLSFAALCAGGRPLASLVARRARQYPVDFGHSSSFVESIEDPEVEQLARRLLAELRWDGLVEVEFKRDPRDGTPKLLDVNPRVWTWHALGARAGVDFPYLLWRAQHGEAVPEQRGKAGCRWMRAATDLPAVATLVARGRVSPLDYVRSLRPPVAFALLTRDDPLPALVNPPLLAARVARRALRLRGRATRVCGPGAARPTAANP